MAQNINDTIIIVAEPEPLDWSSFKVFVIVKVLDASIVPSISFHGFHTAFVTCGQFVEAVDLSKLALAPTK